MVRGISRLSKLFSLQYAIRKPCGLRKILPAFDEVGLLAALLVWASHWTVEEKESGGKTHVGNAACTSCFNKTKPS